jgi:DNA-binding transcriptional LysR family regulator
VKLTNDGATFYELCQNLIKSYDDFITRVFEFKNIIMGKLNIAYQKANEDIVLCHAQKFLHQYSNVILKNTYRPDKNLIEGLSSGEFDFAYIYGDELKKNYSNIKSVRIEILTNMLLVSRRSVLAQKERIPFSELAEHPFIMPNKKNLPVKTEQIMGACVSHGFAPIICNRVDSLFDFILEVINHDAVAVLPYMSSIAESDFVKYLRLDDFDTDYPVDLAWCSTNNNPVISTYISFIKSLVKE